MKRISALILVVLMLALCVPASAFNAASTSQRVQILDLTNATSMQYSTDEGWRYYPTGSSDGKPLLVLNSYGSASAHSAPIMLPKNCTVEVNGECYIDNAMLGEDCDLLTGAADGYLHVTGSGTLNLYADQYYGQGINIALGGNGQGNEDVMEISDVTINYYGMARDMYTAFYLKAAIFAYESLSMHNVTLNTYEGGYGIWMYGHTLIGASLTEETASVLEIDNCNINIESVTGNNWQYAKGIYTTYGNIHIKDSHVVINAGSGSLYAYMTITIDSGSYVYIRSTPVSTADYASIVFCNRLKMLEGMEYFFATRTRYHEADVLYLKETNTCVLGDGLTVVQGSFTAGTFAGAPDPANDNIPTLEVTGNTVVEPTYYTVNFYDYDGTLISTQQVEEGQAATAPAIPQHQNMIFSGWDRDFDCITGDLDVYALYSLLGDADCNGLVNFADISMLYIYMLGMGDLTPQGQLNSDFDQNGSIDFADISAIYMYILGA